MKGGSWSSRVGKAIFSLKCISTFDAAVAAGPPEPAAGSRGFRVVELNEGGKLA